MPDTQPLVDQQGQVHDVPIADAAGAFDRGWRAPTTADSARLTTEAAHEQDYGGAGGGITAGLYGLARGTSLGGSDVLFRAAGVSPERLRGFAEQFPKLTVGAETLGALLPALAAPESLLARSPAGGVAAVGRAIVESAEGAGALGRVAAASAGGAAEGALFSGGQYLSQVALEDKPLAAEGFLGAMGKGALWAAPIGGTLAIGEGVLHRAKGLFPRSQVNKAAAREVDQAATSAISDTVRDGDTMLEVARQKIAQARAQSGAAQSAENASRAMFGAADPATIQNQVTHSVDHATLTGAVDKYTRAKLQFEDWVRVEADPDLEQALLRLRPTNVQSVNAPKPRAIEFGEAVPPQVPTIGGSPSPGLRSPRPGDQILVQGMGGNSKRKIRVDVESIKRDPITGESVPMYRNANGDLDADLDWMYEPAGPHGFVVGGLPKRTNEIAPLETLKPPTPLEFTVERGAAGTPGPHEPPRVPITTDLPPLPLASQDLTRQMDPGELGLKFDTETRNYFRPDTAPDFATPGLAEGTPATLRPDDELLGMLRKLRGEFSPTAEGVIPEYGALKTHLDKVGTDYFEQTIPARAIEERGWYEPPGGRVDKVRAAKARAAVKAKEPPVIALNVTPSGKVVVAGDHYLLDAAADWGAPVRVKWTTGLEPQADEVLRGGTKAVSEGTDAGLADLLQATKGKLDQGESIAKIGAESPARAEYVATKSAKTEEAAATARDAARARAGTYSGSAMAGEERALQEAAAAEHGSELSPFEHDAIARIRADIHEGKVPGYKDLLPRGEQAGAELEYARRQDAKTIVDRSLGKQMRQVAGDGDIKAALRRRNGKDVDIGPNLATGARAIDNLESASAGLVDALGAEAPKTAVERAAAYRSAVQAQAEKSGASAARAAEDIRTKIIPADQITMVEPTPLPKGAFEQDEFAHLKDEIRAGKVKGMIGPFAAEEALERAAEREMALRGATKTVVDKGIKPMMREAREEAAMTAYEAKMEKGIDAAVSKAKAADAKHGPGGQSVARAVAGAIDDIAAKIPAIADASSHAEAAAAPGGEHRKGDRAGIDTTVVDDDVVKALRKHDSKAAPVARTVASGAPEVAANVAGPAALGGRSLLGTAADIGTALEVLHAMGVHTPDVSSIPVIGPVLALFLKARAVLGILGRKGGSIGRSTESVVASKSAAVRDRINAATQSLLTVGAEAARRAQPLAGPAGALAYKLFPGDGSTTSKDPRALYEARMSEIARAQQPGAIEHAVADRIHTSDPDLQDAIVAQTRKGIEFLASKAPREAMLPSMLPGDGKWHPSKAALEQWARYVAAVHDPAGVLEDLAKGHVTAESAETLRVVYPKLYAEAQRALLEHAVEFQHTLKYSRRVTISIMYRIPVDGTMSAAHLQYIQGSPPAAAPPQGPAPGGGAPALTAPLNVGQQTMTSVDRRAGM